MQPVLKMTLKMNWKTTNASLLLLSMYWWMVYVLPPLGAVECATHMAEAGEHCYSFCQRPSFLVEPQQPVFSTSFLIGTGLSPQQRTTILPHPDLAHGRLPPRFSSFVRRLRAPPFLISGSYLRLLVSATIA